MQFLKRHFEKIILSAVLAGLGAAAFWLYAAVEEARSKTNAPSSPVAAKPLPSVETNLVPLRAALKTLNQPPSFDLTGNHNLFNPVTWKKLRDGSLIKMTKAGADALVVTDIKPLYFTITFQSQVGDGFYLIAQPPSGPKMPRQYYRLNEKPDKVHVGTIVGTNAAPDKPGALTLQLRLTNSDDVVLVSSTAPYKRVEGYEVDMRYSGSDATNFFTSRHVGDPLLFSGESFKILAIASNAVTVQDTRTAQKTEKEWNRGL
jgi:hypothetical protein